MVAPRHLPGQPRASVLRPLNHPEPYVVGGSQGRNQAARDGRSAERQPSPLEGEESRLGTGGGRTLRAHLARLASGITDLSIPGAHWTRRRLASALRGFPKLDILQLEEGKWGESCTTPAPKLDPPPFRLRTLIWDGYGFSEEAFQIVTSSSATTLECLCAPIYRIAIDFSAFSQLTKLQIDLKESGSWDGPEMAVAQGIVSTLRSCRQLEAFMLSEGASRCTSSAWKEADFFTSLPTSISFLDIDYTEIDRLYLLAFLRNTSLTPKLSTLCYNKASNWGAELAGPGLLAEEAAIAEICAERGIALSGRWTLGWTRAF